jgi:hypothetical protein
MVKTSVKSQVIAIAICANLTNSVVAQEVIKDLKIVEASG